MLNASVVEKEMLRFRRSHAYANTHTHTQSPFTCRLTLFDSSLSIHCVCRIFDACLSQHTRAFVAHLRTTTANRAAVCVPSFSMFAAQLSLCVQRHTDTQERSAHTMGREYLRCDHIFAPSLFSSFVLVFGRPLTRKSS